MEPTLSMSEVLTEEWKIFFVVFSSLGNINSLGSIIGLFSRLLNTKSCSELNASNQTEFISLEIYIEFV